MQIGSSFSVASSEPQRRTHALGASVKLSVVDLSALGSALSLRRRASFSGAASCFGFSYIGSSVSVRAQYRCGS